MQAHNQHTGRLQNAGPCESAAGRRSAAGRLHTQHTKKTLTTHTICNTQDDAKTLGRVKVPLMDVAAAGRLRGAWPLQGALEGQLEMVCEWIDAGMVEP